MLPAVTRRTDSELSDASIEPIIIDTSTNGCTADLDPGPELKFRPSTEIQARLLDIYWT
jgi:hypothetical protein